MVKYVDMERIARDHGYGIRHDSNGWFVTLPTDRVKEMVPADSKDREHVVNFIDAWEMAYNMTRKVT